MLLRRIHRRLFGRDHRRIKAWCRQGTTPPPLFVRVHPFSGCAAVVRQEPAQSLVAHYVAGAGGFGALDSVVPQSLVCAFAVVMGAVAQIELEYE